MRGMDFIIKSPADLIETINKYGFLPYFKNSIEGFSIEEHIEPRYWFGDEDGAWEWKAFALTLIAFPYNTHFLHYLICFNWRNSLYFYSFLKVKITVNPIKVRYLGISLMLVHMGVERHSHSKNKLCLWKVLRA